MRRHELSDEEWTIIAPLLPNNSRGIECVDDRRVINGILWRFRTGSSWRDVPERYGPRTTLKSVLPLAQGGRLGSPSGRRFKALRWRHRDDRQFLCSRSSAWCQR